MIYFDNAATTGMKPQGVIKAVSNSLKNYSANPGRGGHKPSIEASELVYGVREKAAKLFGASGPENVVFTLNCTHSLNAVIKGVLHMGDHVIVSSVEHNAVMRPLKKIGVSFDLFKVSLSDDNETLKDFIRKIKPNTRLVICTGASNVTGKILPIAEIGEICRKRGILFCVDAAQIAGVLPVNMQEMNIDYLCVAPHKGLYAPMGTGILICEKPIGNTILEGGTGTNSLELIQPETLPERLESGTVNLPGIAGIGAGIDFVNQMGTERIYNHEMRLTSLIYGGLKNNPNIILYTPDPKMYKYAPVLSFNFKGVPSTTTAALLSQNGFALRGGLHCAPMAHRQLNTAESGTVRLSVGVFNSIAQAESFIRLINNEKFIKKLKKAIEPKDIL